MSTALDYAIEYLDAANKRLEAADDAWNQAAAAYRAEFCDARKRNEVLDEFGLPTGESRPFSPVDRARLAPLESAECGAWAKRQSAQDVFDRARAQLEQCRGRR